MHSITHALKEVDVAALGAALSPDVVFHSPVLATVADELRGRDLAVQILITAVQGFGAPKNVTEFRTDDGRFIAAFDGEIDGHLLNVLILFEQDAEGKVISIAPHMRPYPIVTLFRDHMHANLCPDPVPEAIWALPAAV